MCGAFFVAAPDPTTSYYTSTGVADTSCCSIKAKVSESSLTTISNRAVGRKAMQCGWEVRVAESQSRRQAAGGEVGAAARSRRAGFGVSASFIVGLVPAILGQEGLRRVQASWRTRGTDNIGDAYSCSVRMSRWIWCQNGVQTREVGRKKEKDFNLILEL